MDIFISWSGERSRYVAAALAELLPDAIQDVKAWMSAHDIGAGSRWSQELNQQLEASNFGVLCLTPENIAAPWLLFEAGSLAKSVSGGRVVPYRLQLTAADVSFPLAQFQGVDADESGTKKLLQGLNSALKQPMDGERLERVFQRWWPDLNRRLAIIPTTEHTAPTPRPEREVLDEILDLVRENARPTRLKSPLVENHEAFSESKVPKSAVWRTLHDITETDLQRMTSEELNLFIAKVRERDMVTPHGGEETSLFHLEQRANQERDRRERLKQPESSDAADSTLKNADNR